MPFGFTKSASFCQFVCEVCNHFRTLTFCEYYFLDGALRLWLLALYEVYICVVYIQYVVKGIV